MKNLTIREFKRFVANIPTEWDDEELIYADFSYTPSLNAVVSEEFHGVLISDTYDKPTEHTYLQAGVAPKILRVES